MTRYLETRGGLIVPSDFAEPVGQPESQEIATVGLGRDITRGYVQPLLLLQQQDSILRAKGGGSYRLYREVLRDDQVKAAFSQRQLAVVSREWEVTPGGDAPREEEAAELLRDELPRIGFDQLTGGMLYGVFYGYAVAEVLWGRRGNRVSIEGVRVRDRERFRFDGQMRLRLLTMTNPAPGEELPDRKFWYFATGADHDDEPYGLGLAHWLYWPVFFKRGGIKLWLTFLDKFGAPTAKGEYPPNATQEERNKLLQALEAIHSESGVIVPEGMAIELLEAARSGSVSYTELYDRMDAAIAKIIVGQTATVQGTPGRLGGDDAQQDVREELVKADADLVCDSFNRSVARWLTEYNFGPDIAPPKVWRKVSPPEDLTAVAERDAKLKQVGYRPTAERVAEIYGPGYERDAPAPATPGVAFAERVPGGHAADQEQIDSEAERLAAEWQRLMGARLDLLLAYAEESGDIETFRRRLAELASAEPDATMRETLARVGFSSQLWGALRAQRDRRA